MNQDFTDFVCSKLDAVMLYMRAKLEAAADGN